MHLLTCTLCDPFSRPRVSAPGARAQGPTAGGATDGGEAEEAGGAAEEGGTEEICGGGEKETEIRGRKGNTVIYCSRVYVNLPLHYLNVKEAFPKGVYDPIHNEYNSLKACETIQ